MIKKTIVAAVACVLAAPAAMAQQTMTADSTYTVETKNADKWRVETNKFGANWFVGLGAGAQMYFGDHDKQMRFGDRLTPNFEAYFGKWFTPGIGVRIGANGYKIKGVAGWDNHKGWTNNNRGNYGGFIIEPREEYTNPRNHTGYPLYKTKLEYVHGHADVLFNVTQMVLGYKPDRFYSLIPYASLGFITSTNKSSVTDRHSHEMTGGIGVINRFRINDAWDINFDVRATYTGDHFDQEYGAADRTTGTLVATSGRWGEGLLTATLGVSYNIPKRGWDRSTVTTIRVNENVLQGLRGRIGQLENENQDLMRQLEAALNRKVTSENVAAMPLLVTFPIDRWVLSNKDRVNLGFLADVLKANPKMVYTISGYADKGTGSVKRNIFLARKRADVVYNCLVKEFGVSESQLKKDSHGGVGNMYYNDPRCSRSVLTKIAQ